VSPRYAKLTSVLTARTSLFVVLITSAIALMACSGGSDATPSPTAKAQTIAVAPTISGPVISASASVTPPSAAGPIDVCSLVSFQEASAYLGATVPDRARALPIAEDVGSGVNAQVSACGYTEATTGSFLKIELWQAFGQASQLEQLTQNGCDGNAEIAGLGDFACWYNSSHSELQLVKGDAYLHVTSSTPGSAVDALKTIAETALSRLP
jgi:hypothetical protein